MSMYKKLKIYDLASELEHKIYILTMKLPNLEKYEMGSQIRRSAQSVRSNIAEGYGRRNYKQEFLRYLYFSISSCDETTSHLEILNKRYPELNIEKTIYQEYLILGKKINKFISYVKTSWRT